MSNTGIEVAKRLLIAYADLGPGASHRLYISADRVRF